MAKFNAPLIKSPQRQSRPSPTVRPSVADRGAGVVVALALDLKVVYASALWMLILLWRGSS